MGIKETPTNFRVYYRSMIDTYTQKRIDAVDMLSNTVEKNKELYENVKTTFEQNKDSYSCDITKYPEFVENKYTTGTFYTIAKNIFLNRKQHSELVINYYTLYKLAKSQKDIHDLNKSIELYDKMLNLSINEYCAILKQYYTKVQERMILNGEGYSLGGKTGWICINRCKVHKSRKRILNFEATKKNKKKLIAEGKRIYNKEEAEWCRQNNIEYNAVDARVFIKNEYCYEIPLLGSQLKHGNKLKFEAADYRSAKLRGKTNEDLKREANYNTKKICEYDVDIRTKLNMCVESDKTLYYKFIRNETQETSVSREINRKD